MMVKITQERFNELIRNLAPGSFDILAEPGHILIRGLYVNYSVERSPNGKV